MMKSFYLFNHQKKGTAYFNALIQNGYTFRSAKEASVIFSDIDMPGRIKPLADNFRSKKSRLFIYPHAARVNLAWDGIIPVNKYTTAVFVSAEGHKNILELYGFNKPIHVSGWSYCRMLPFFPIKNPRKVLFAPIHPSKRGWLSDINKKINIAAFNKLLKLVKNGDIELWVRHLRSIEENGLWNENGVNYIQGQPDLSFAQIDAADIIVAHQTFGYLAVARGKPVVMMAEGTPPHNSTNPNDTKFVASWEKYKHIVMYPYDVMDYDDTMRLFQEVSWSDDKIRLWRDTMIGVPFQGSLVVKGIEKYL